MAVPQSISAVEDGRIIALIALMKYGGNTWGGRVDMYNVDGSRDRSADLPGYVRNPWCLAYPSRMTFAITYGSYKYGVICIDIEGRLLAKCDIGLTMPRSTVYDKEANSLIVADVDRNRLVRFNMKLELHSVLYSWDGNSDDDNNQPMRMSLDEKRGRLFVGMKSGRVSLFHTRNRKSAVHEA